MEKKMFGNLLFKVDKKYVLEFRTVKKTDSLMIDIGKGATHKPEEKSELFQWILQEKP